MVSEEKRKTVQEFVNLIDEYPIIAAVNMENLPAKQLQKMVSSLRDKMILKMCKRRLLKIAIEKSSKKNIRNIEEYLVGMPALIFTKENPFKLYKILEKSKSNAPAKAGQKAPKDIVIPAGPTSFAPGPIIGELGSVGIKTGVENGKVAVKEDSTVAKEGDKINQELAKILARMGIEPMEIGLNIVAIYENGEIFKKDILSIDETKYISDIQNAARASFNLALELGYPTKDNIQVLIAKAFNDSKDLALSQDLITDLTLGNTISKAESQMKSLTNKLNLPEEKKMEQEKPEEPQEESKQEQKDVKESDEKKQEVEEKTEEENKQEEAKKETEEIKENKESKQEGTEKKEESDEKKQEVEEKPEDIKEEKKKETNKDKIDEKSKPKTEEKKLGEASEEDVQSSKNVSEEDIKQAEENLKKIQEKLQKG